MSAHLLALALAILLAVLPPGGSFIDDAGNVHEGGIEAIAEAGITAGCNHPANNRYCPAETVTRGQMAVFLARALGLPPVAADHFGDDTGGVSEDAINRVAGAGITFWMQPTDERSVLPEPGDDEG